MSAQHVTKRPGLIHPKQIDTHIDGNVLLAGLNLAAPGATLDVSAAVAAFVATGGRNGVAVPNQVAADIDTQGVVLDGIVPLNDATGAVPKNPANDAEVYGRLTGTAGAYTLSFFTAPGGVEAPYTMPAGTYDAQLSYRYDFRNFPPTGTTSPMRTRVSQDPAGAGAVEAEMLTIAATDTVPALAKTPRPGTCTLNVNGQRMHVGLTPGLTIAGNTITWDAVTIGYPLESTDFVVAEYLAGS